MLLKLKNKWIYSTTKTKVGLISVFFYGLGLVYIAANRLLIPGHNNDVIYRLLGIDIRVQFFLLNLIMVVGIIFWTCIFLRKQIPLKLADTKSSQRRLTILSALVFANAAASSAGSVIADMSERFLLPVYAWLTIVLIVQSGITALVLPRLRSAILQLLLLVFFGVLSIYAMNFSLASWFRTGGLVLQTFALVTTSLLVACLFMTVLFRRAAWKNATLILALTFFAPIISIGLRYISDNTTPLGPLDRFAKITLSSTPDIHIVSLDALAPPELAARYLEIERTPYAAALRDEGVRRFPNAFATNVPTKWSLNSVMRLAQDDAPPYFDYFSGLRASPLSTLLSNNGYQIATGFPVTYLGYKGAHVDSFKPDPSWSVRNSAICVLAGASPVTFFGFCEVGAILDKERVKQPWRDQVVDILEDYLTRADGPPTFTYHHVLDPVGHTPLDYRTDNMEARSKYRDFFLSRSKSADKLIRKLSHLERLNTRKAIIILTGDHGLWVSRTVKIEEDRTFFVQDRHAIVLATLLDQSGCAPGELEYFMPNYATPERLLAGLFRCLSSDPQSFERTLSFSEPFDFGEYPYSDPK